MSPFREPARVTPDPSREAADLLRYEAELRRSQRRRDRAVSALKWAGLVLFVAAISLAVGLLIRWEYKRRAACDERGGVWLSREGKCVRGVER